MTDKPKRKRGRPSTFTQDIANRVCAELRKGRTLRDTCSDEGMPPVETVLGWAGDDVGGFWTQYARARDIGYQVMADELLAIADDDTGDLIELPGGQIKIDHENIQRSRLRVDTRKWLLSKALPKLYGDKLHTELTGADGGPIRTADDVDLRDLARAMLGVVTEAQLVEEEEAPTAH